MRLHEIDRAPGNSELHDQGARKEPALQSDQQSKRAD
jgi:hypothetical protein